MCCNKDYQRKFDENLKKRFFNKREFSNHDTSKFIWFLQKGVYPNEYMDNWKKFTETLLPEKDDFYSHLNMEYITDSDHKHAKRVCKDFKLRNFKEYHVLYVQSNTLLLADVLENFRNSCLEIYELDPAHLLTAPGLA